MVYRTFSSRNSSSPSDHSFYQETDSCHWCYRYPVYEDYFDELLRPTADGSRPPWAVFALTQSPSCYFDKDPANRGVDVVQGLLLREPVWPHVTGYRLIQIGLCFHAGHVWSLREYGWGTKGKSFGMRIFKTTNMQVCCVTSCLEWRSLCHGGKFLILLNGLRRNDIWTL